MLKAYCPNIYTVFKGDEEEIEKQSRRLVKGGLILESIFNSIPSKKWLKPDPTNLFSIIFVGAASKNETIIILNMY